MRPFSIETSWGGFRFRSRLEARWALFFSKLGIQFQYEPEGFELQECRYLPDFYLPQVSWWAEIKPERFTFAEESKPYSLVKTTGYKLLMLDGPPAYRSYDGFHRAVLADGTKQVDHCDYSLDVDTYEEAFKKERRLWASPSFYPLTINDPAEKFAEVFSERYQRAVNASRAERFGS